jgi:hypothetical protein
MEFVGLSAFGGGSFFVFSKFSDRGSFPLFFDFFEFRLRRIHFLRSKKRTKKSFFHRLEEGVFWLLFAARGKKLLALSESEKE